MSDISCKHPLKGFQIGLTNNGKPNYKITSYDIDYVSIRDRPGMLDITCNTGKPSFVPGWKNITDFIEIPCGHCISCRLRYSKEWANRLMLELKYHDEASFVTLTYDNEHLPEPNDVIDDDGVISKSVIHPLVKRDLQLFMKRLRKHYPDKRIRFYACGEYGSKNMRPHYHVILFGVNFSEDRYCFTRNDMGQVIYRSPTLEKLWTYGLSSVCEVEWNCCAYVARYVTKKLSGPAAAVYEENNFPREWSVCSRRPGIARLYYDEHKEDIYENEEIFISCGSKGGKKIRPPKYYDRLYDIDYPEDFAIIKDKRKEICEVNQKLRSNLSSLDYLEQLAVDEENLIARTNKLVRE